MAFAESTISLFVLPLVVRVKSLFMVQVVPLQLSQLMLLEVMSIWLLVLTWIVLNRLFPVLKRKVFARPKLPKVRSPSTVKFLVETSPENVPRTALRFPEQLALVVAMPKLVHSALRNRSGACHSKSHTVWVGDG